MRIMKKSLALFTALLLVTLAGCAPSVTGGQDRATAALAQAHTAVQTKAPASTAAPARVTAPDRNGAYTTRDDVALYIHTYGTLPGNFITKADARALGWTGGALARYAPGKSIGGDLFGNFEGLLPKAAGRVYHECDIDTGEASASRGARRIVFSSDGLVYYTGDHYQSFTLLYGGKGT
jgi:ribonuclease T1